MDPASWPDFAITNPPPLSGIFILLCGSRKVETREFQPHSAPGSAKTKYAHWSYRSPIAEPFLEGSNASDLELRREYDTAFSHSAEKVFSGADSFESMHSAASPPFSNDRLLRHNPISCLRAGWKRFATLTVAHSYLNDRRIPGCDKRAIRMKVYHRGHDSWKQ
ncbi:uncharacterized protein EI90DRAFT_3121007 [Cantharellus anzutake]|uniref:uncharacterized protein n=1 Tax=Cantharellus anzutake TaxID=1750568 RepID=UPI001906F64C|nr:uncharacterized protein EI90DRAFT_3121007 [Cantharellus anzutake]KAF8334599.1 hypothetical protein EI90DRAFT_3121007 [Cantharellus anzutake]